jgi:hypothetical protein
MKPTTKEVGDRHQAERRTPPADRHNVPRQVAGERQAQEGEALGEAMVDALADILKWERASERSLRVAKARDLPN